jgi:hypothetical protein
MDTVETPVVDLQRQLSKLTTNMADIAASLKGQSRLGSSSSTNLYFYSAGNADAIPG